MNGFTEKSEKLKPHNVPFLYSLKTSENLRSLRVVRRSSYFLFRSSSSKLFTKTVFLKFEKIPWITSAVELSFSQRRQAFIFTEKELHSICTEAQPRPPQTSKMESFVTIIQPLTFVAKHFILDICGVLATSLIFPWKVWKQLFLRTSLIDCFYLPCFTYFDFLIYTELFQVQLSNLNLFCM